MLLTHLCRIQGNGTSWQRGRRRPKKKTHQAQPWHWGGGAFIFQHRPPKPSTLARMKSHHATALLLLGILVLWMEPISATIKKISRANLHNETEAEPPRPGECPKPTLPGLPHPSQAYCIEGQPCPGDEKCCRIGNIMKCVLPVGVHPGYCPWPERAVASSKSCSWDTECALDEKCCPIKGHQRCTKATPANPGLCPKKPLPPVLYTCKNKCEDDRSCPEGEKCCFVECGLKCVPPESHHSGDQVELDRNLDPEADHRDVCVLPAEPGPCNGYFPRFFFNSTSGKCEEFVYGGCGGNANNFLTKEKCLRVCSREEKDGLCPARAPPGAIDPCFGRCSNDSQCPGETKCCKIGCGMACLEPLSEKEGTCPVIAPSCLLSPFFIQCFRDSQCPGRMKCCHAPCAMVCLEPVPEPPRPGDCPKPTLPGLPPPVLAYCVEDKPCPGDEKCCRVGNIMRCVLPVGVHRGYCPRRERDENSIKICSWDTDCASDKKCCPSDGPQMCTKAVPVNPGLCPKKALPPVFTPCKDQCRDDRSCPKGQKCCFVDCGLKCVPPESHHSRDLVLPEDDAFSLDEDDGEPPIPGQCPKPTLPGLPRPILAYCLEDKPCPGDEKCCRVGNIMKCVLPVGAHPGYCPKRESDVTPAKSCSWDTDCAKDEKCCPSEGRQRCAKAVPANPGLCPKKALPPVFTPCKDQCRDDRSCPDGQKCCFVDCGLKCVPPESHHSGDQVELDRDEDAPLLDGDHGDVCLLPSDQGDCDARFPRFFFNSTSGKCEKFIYGGCGGNANNFVTKEKCLRVCSGKDVCLLPSDQGDCDAHIPRFFYNSASGECEKFIYGGCGGNENNFLNKEECLQVCSGKEKEGVWRSIVLLGKPDDCFTRCSKKKSYPSWWKFCQIHCAVACVEPQPDHCLLPPNPGNCREHYTRFFYNSASRRCQKFIYGGCGGNKNNFQTREECLRVCAHVAPRKPGMCPSRPLHEIPRSGQAYCMDDSACPGDEKCCQIGNITKCVLPLEATHPGYCPSNEGAAAASSLRCFWDTDCAPDEKCCPSQEHKKCTKAVPATPGSCPKKCLPWVFTRCANKCKDDRSCPDGHKCCFFECGLRCVPPKDPHAGQQMEPDQDRALLVPDMDLGEKEDTCPLAAVLDEPDPCLHLFSLQTRCPRKWRYCQIDYGVPGLELQPDYCLLPPERGNCHREVTRFFYDSVTRKCKKFTYGGCGANENNFLTSTECLRVCEGVVTPKPGDCPRETFPEYQPLTYDYCFEDAACPGEEKCCRVGTIRKCILLEGVHHGYCPEKKDVKLSSKSCSWDTDCASDEKCCPSERRKRCTKAVPEKPGLCPMKCFARVFSRCKNECKDDRSCPEGKKCCFADCGLKCVPAVDRHGGHRPAADGNCGARLLTTVGECPRPQGAGPCVEMCTGDESCGPGEKCCSNGCGHVCTKVSGAPPLRTFGNCPRPQGAGICVELCTSDESCGPGEKCCSNGCGHVCTKVTGGHQDHHFTEFASRSTPDLCKLPRDSGSCNATSVARVFYNSQTGRCEMFPYKGCGGNKNNFATQLECLRTCSDPGICLLPMDQGWGDAFRTRYFYNSTSRTCESFLYRGHRGNANNFREKEGCLQFCGAHDA